MGWSGACDGSTTSSQKRWVQSQSSVPSVAGLFGDELPMVNKSCHCDGRSIRDSRRSSIEGAARSGQPKGAAEKAAVEGEFHEVQESLDMRPEAEDEFNVEGAIRRNVLPLLILSSQRFFTPIRQARPGSLRCPWAHSRG
jgi:hypothetical protein